MTGPAPAAPLGGPASLPPSDQRPDPTDPTGPAGPTDPTTWSRLRRWRPTRRGAALGFLLALALVVLALAAPGRAGYLDPTAVDPSGSRAVANVLGDLGVSVADVRLTQDALARSPGATVLVTDPSLPTDEVIDALLDAGPRQVILVQAGPLDPAFTRLAAGIEVVGPTGDEEVAPGCALHAAQQAGPAVLPGLAYDARAWEPTAAACYDRAEEAAVVVLPRRAGRPEVVLLGSPHPLTNDGFDDAGNAALVLNLLGSEAQLVWWRPTAQDPALAAEVPPSLIELVPKWVSAAVAQLVVVVVVVVWWRGRRFGPLVIEPLPVIVRAGETMAGRARLLQANHARGEAAEHLRSAARERIRRRLGLPAGVQPDRLVAATTARTGRAGAQVGWLLYGPEPGGDPELVALEHDLDALLAAVGTVEVGRG